MLDTSKKFKTLQADTKLQLKHLEQKNQVYTYLCMKLWYYGIVAIIMFNVYCLMNNIYNVMRNIGV